MPALSDEQFQAVSNLLGSKDQIVCLRGAAGVGKTTMIKAMQAPLESDGRKVFYCAPTSSAAETLRQDGISGATTLSNFLQNVAIRNRPDLEQSVFIVDEAGLASNAQGAQILKLADECRARVIFFGDSRQHSSVEAGDFLRILEKHSPLHRVEVTEIRRQQQAGYREAVQLMALGASRAGLEKLDHLGCVKEGKAAYLDGAVKDFLEYAKKPSDLSQVIAVAPTWAENHAFTDQLRHSLKERSLLGSGERISCLESLQWTRAQKSKAEHFQPGFVVRFIGRQKGFEQEKRYEVSRVADRSVWLNTDTGEKRLPLREGHFDVLRAKEQEVCAGERLLVLANDRKQALVNGEVFSVRKIRGGVIETVDGKQIDTRTFSSLGYGYAVTSHKSQSKTVDHVIVAAERLDAKSAYVACSRGRLTCTVHTPDRAKLFEHLPDGNRTAAVEAIGKSSEGVVRSPAESLPNLLAKADTHQRHTVDRWLHHELWRGLTEGLRNVWDRLSPGRSVDATPKKVGHENERHPP
jgi:ATP-dependent exoDNAse (exonuclease V) alpha subunit